MCLFSLFQLHDKDLDGLAEMYLCDLVMKASLSHDSSKNDLKRVNDTLNQLGAKSPFAFLRVIVHVTSMCAFTLVCCISYMLLVCVQSHLCFIFRTCH